MITTLQELLSDVYNFKFSAAWLYKLIVLLKQLRNKPEWYLSKPVLTGNFYITRKWLSKQVLV